MEQLSIFDIIEPIPSDIPCGYIEDLRIIGRQLRFVELKDMIGKKCVMLTNSCYPGGYKVVRITEYFVDSDKVYKRIRPLPENAMRYADRVNDYIHDIVGQKEAMDCYELDYICDRIGYSDNERYKNSNSWVSEMYCLGGRFEPLETSIISTFYELNML